MSTTLLPTETQAEAETIHPKPSMTFTQPTQDILERLPKLSKAYRILSHVYRFCDRASLARGNKFRHDSIVLDRKFSQSIDSIDY